MNSLFPSIKKVLLESVDVVRMPDLRRSTLLFAQNQPSDSLYLIEDGLVKLTRTNAVNDRIILAIRGANDLIGEEVLSGDQEVFQAEAEVLTNVSVLRVPGKALRASLSTNSEWIAPLITYILSQKMKLAEKVEMLCLHDVEYRILHYLAELSTLVRPVLESREFQIPITQLELADLIGATRETTSTTLNQLERRGLIKLSRRMLTVPSPERLRSEISPKYKAAVREDRMISVPDLSAQPWQN